MATEQEKRKNFSRLFPPTVERLIDRLRVVKQKSNKHNYAWDQDKVHDVWIEIAKAFARVAKDYEVEFDVLVDGVEVDYVEYKFTKGQTK